jgi:hypothetical protein
MQNNEPLCSDRSSTIDVSSISSLTVSWFSLSSLKKQINNNFLFQTVSSNKYTTNHLFALYWTDFLNSKHRLWCVHMSLRSMPRLYISLERLLGFKWPSVVLSEIICDVPFVEVTISVLFIVIIAKIKWRMLISGVEIAHPSGAHEFISGP